VKRYSLSFAESTAHKPASPERTARKSGNGLNFDVTFQVWPSRVAMARSIRMQQKGAPRSDHWRACVPLADGEGY
jgi:hypothetical protein